MSGNSGKRNINREYRFRVITYAATCLSENEDVEYYELYTNSDKIPGFDDLIIRVKYKSKNGYFVYMSQIAHLKGRFNLNCGRKYNLKHYKNVIEEIITRKSGYSFLCDVPNENLEFWFFFNGRFTYSRRDPILLARDELLPSIECDLSENGEYNTIFPRISPATCHKLVPRCTNEDSYFFDKLHLLQCQPDNDKIKKSILNLDSKLFSDDIVSKIVGFVEEYFTMKCSEDKFLCLTKEIFETELLRLCLSTYTISPTHATSIYDELAPLWNNITLKYDVTVIDSDIIDVVPLLFGCFWKKINGLYDDTFEWNSCINNGKKLSVSFDTSLLEQNNIRHYISKPDTIDSLLMEMWKCDHIPLILDSDCNLSLLEKYRHLKRKFIVLDAGQKIIDKIRLLHLKVFTTAADIYNCDESSELFGKILISLQGRKPISLLSLIIENTDIMGELKCFHVLRLLEQKRLFLRRECLDASNSILFIIINDQNFQEDVNFDKLQIQCNSNVTIYCKSTDVEMFKMRFKTSERLMNYSLCHVQELEGKLLYLGGDMEKIAGFLVDGNEEEVYIGELKAVTIIGKALNDTNEKYITRYLKKATLEEPFFISQERQVYVFTGEIDSLNPLIKNQTINGCIDEVITYIKNRLRENKSSFIVADKSDWDEYWRRLSPEPFPLFQICVRNGKMELLRYKAFQSLSKFISYEGEEFEENDFFTKTTNGITVVSGEPGIGKSTLLRSLFKAGDSTTYSLFCDLVDYRNDLKQADAEIFKDPLNHILGKFEELTIPSTKSLIYGNILRSLRTTYQDKRKLVLYVDSFDEILPIYKQEVLKFVRSIAETNIRIVIASRLIADGLLINNFEVVPIQVSKLHRNDVKTYLQGRGVTVEQLEEIPSDLLGNPLYLTRLDILRQDGGLIQKNMNTFNLCKQDIEKKVQLYYSKRGLPYDCNIYQRESVLGIHKLLAVATVFGKEVIVKNEGDYEKWVKKCQHEAIKLGIIVRFSDDYPVFIHHTYGEFLAAEYISEHKNKEFVRYIYQKMLAGRNIHVRRLFDNFLCENLELHRAVIKENFTEVEHFCVKKCELLDLKDNYDRSAIHLAASYCHGDETFTIRNCKILETLARYMEQRQCDLEACDMLMGYKWFEYIEDNENVFDEARRLGLTRILNSATSKYVITIKKSEKNMSSTI